MESQNVEYKQTWKDDYLKWICGFANAQGGTIYVGIDDNGNVCGIKDAKRLLEDIPNKARDVLGIVVDVNLYQKDGNEFLEVVTNAYPYPVSYKGQYHYRSGSTKQELKGAALDRFMLRKQGRSWDGAPIPNLTADDLDSNSFDIFRRYAKQSGRMDEPDLKENNSGLIEKLRLNDGQHLKRAAVLLFYADPEKYVTGAYIKIGYFKKNANLIFQDEVHGSLFQQVRTTIDLLTTKYLRALISYDDIQRVESLPMPKEALREALLNAVVHKAYESLTPIQISVFDDRLELFNCGYLPEEWGIEKLLGKHNSRPYNPDIANAFFRAGEIETWGRGIERIVNACKDAGVPKPDIKYTDGELLVIFHFSKEYQTAISQSEGGIVRSIVENKDGIVENIVEKLPEVQSRIFRIMLKNPSITAREIANDLSIAQRNVQGHIRKLKEKGLVCRVGPDKGGHWEIVLPVTNTD